MSDIRNLVIVLGDQLNHDSAALDDFDNQRDRVWMAENQEEATHVWCHKFRLVGFFAPMRHFRDELSEKGRQVLYHALPTDGRKARTSNFASLLTTTLNEHDVQKMIVVHPGDHRVLESLKTVADEQSVALEIRDDRHFYCTIDQFRDWADGRNSLVLETFYRHMRKQHDVLMDGGDPVSGVWNHDKENRGTFGKSGPGDVPHTHHFRPDDVTQDVIDMVNQRFDDHPGKVDASSFDLPVTRSEALTLLREFIKHRLCRFGDYQDAMWSDQKYLYHSRLSHAINLHLLSPREVVDKAIAAFDSGDAPINSVEGFVRQILGWREFVRGIYWTHMPDYQNRNALQCDDDQDVPSFFWDGKTDMACVADAMRLLIEAGYAHHIQRLMVLGLFAQLYGTHPAKFHQWHMAMYNDAVDWVSLPNALGMSQWGDGGLMATKPYCASGKYIKRMGNHCKGCRYNPDEATGDDACPFTTLYWDFLDRHQQQFKNNTRMTMQLKNLQRKDASQMNAIRDRAQMIRRDELDL
ncbi:cryptochrome/photolyase family protein [Crateriforma conspicua]|uniref:Deoxyribodipyrimidine photo-lyase-related protein n=1 Tax=Crateriforma conspicua TaxID=2527996 RepID=A0A5C5XRI6_9PLAN|nr:cryptochrome/photolyase family protein [Crateriforma conspicua]TWT65504.1 Deoxyribodipyrimidine photo-lyase-related protein [Crateriforma conspicua]